MTLRQWNFRLYRLSWILTACTLAAAPGGCGVPGPDGPADSFGVDFSMAEDAEVRGAITFFVDGVSADVFADMLAVGELPSIDKYFIQRGLYVKGAVASTPSVTLANQTSIVTGRFPGHHGVTGINWFDRNRMLYRDYETIAQKNTLDGDYRVDTIFEQFPDATTISVFFQAHRGATKFFENRTSAGPAYFFRMFDLVDRISLHRLKEVMEIARTQNRLPAFTMVYMLAPDFQAYAHGVRSQAYRDALLHTDRQIGRVLGDLDAAGLLEKVLIALVSDHSMMEVERHFQLADFVRDDLHLSLARSKLWENTTFEKRMAYYRKFQAVLYGSGCRYWALCLRRPVRSDGEVVGYASWPLRPSPTDLAAYPTETGPVNLLDRLVSVKAVDAVAYAVGSDRVRVRRAEGEVEFHQSGGAQAPIRYTLIAGQDPLGYARHLGADLRDGAARDPREWLEATADSDYPDLPAQILAYFRAPRAGDIAVFAAPGWDCDSDLHAGHGGLRPADMLTPMLLAGPGVPRRRLRTARTVDLTPTLLTLLGRPVPDGLDGRPLLQPGRNLLQTRPDRVSSPPVRTHP